ncbi:MAG TPA: hypothetical protein VKO63_08955, partial [Chitinispirillaceae bacterium]|nr:hypothetical protein [Chitinispirillaceae bacterium]
MEKAKDKAKDKDAMVYLSRSLLIRLTDQNKNPLPLAKCRIIGDADTIIECDENGVAHLPVPSGNPKGIDLEWEPQDAARNDAANRFYFKGSFDLNVTSKNDEQCTTRLTNLGFIGDTLAEQVNAYQSCFGRVPTGTLNDIRNEMVEWHDGGNYPGWVPKNSHLSVPVSSQLNTTNSTPAASSISTLPKILSSGWSLEVVHEKAGAIDIDNSGSISLSELNNFMQNARTQGMLDESALAWYRKYETAAGLAEIQGRTPGRHFTDTYLNGSYVQELRKVKATDDDIKQINNVLFPQIHTILGTEPLSRLIDQAGLTDIDRKGVTAYYKQKGKTTAFIYDDNKNEIIDTQDFLVLNNNQSILIDSDTANLLNATAALIEFMRAYATNKPAFMFNKQSKFEQWLPSKFWQWEPYTDGKFTCGFWKYRGTDAASDILDFLINSGNYSGDCATLKQLAAHHVLLHQIGREHYNQLVAKHGLYIGFSGDHNKKGLGLKVIKSMIQEEDVDIATFEPGTMGFARGVIKDPPPNGDWERREFARQTIKNNNYSGEHFIIWINHAGEKVVFA